MTSEADQASSTYDLPLIRILDPSTCVIGLVNPRYRVSDESFCRQSLTREQAVVRKYTLMAVVNFFIFGISNFFVLNPSL
jgi:hypothetical protein